MGQDAHATTAGGAVADEARRQILDSAIVLYRARAFHEVTLEQVARHARVEATAVTERFPDVNTLVIEVIEVWNERRMRPLLQVGQHQGAAAFLRGIVTSNVLDPGLMRLLAAMVNIAATPAHPLAGRLHEDWLHFHASIQRMLIVDIERGREPATMDPARGAEQLIAIYEGLQLQSMVRLHMDLLGAFDRAITRLRAGWAVEYQAPSWETSTATVWQV